ncbi:MAG: serine kinase [Rhodobacteraceae bacterium]|nr:serine kinase [Paracoccaceae bacterium]
MMVLHASCVAIDRRGLLIRGASGRGKSALCLQLMAFGAVLIGDDRVEIRRTKEGVLRVSAVPALRGLIEARGVGILRAAEQDWAAPVAIVDLDHSETDRLPHPRTCDLLGERLPLFHAVAASHFSAALLQYLKSGLYEMP